jgi:hypothetical protein
MMMMTTTLMGMLRIQVRDHLQTPMTISRFLVMSWQTWRLRIRPLRKLVVWTSPRGLPLLIMIMKYDPRV